jgi:hypothetical protein
MDRNFALMVADKCEYAVLSTVDAEGAPYCMPLSIARAGEDIYFHSAVQGEKTDCLRREPRVCISCVGETKLVPAEYSTEYESAIIRGLAEEVTDEQEKIHALRLISERYAASNLQAFDKVVAENLRRTAIWRVHITSATGKRIKYDSDGNEMKFGRV